MAVMPRIILSLLFQLELEPEQLIVPDMEHRLPVEPEPTCTQEDHQDQAVQCHLEARPKARPPMALMDHPHNVLDPHKGVTPQLEHPLLPPQVDPRAEMAILEGTERCIKGFERCFEMSAEPIFFWKNLIIFCSCFFSLSCTLFFSPRV